jgi:hypothetical protein
MQDHGTIIDAPSDLGQIRRGVDVGRQFSIGICSSGCWGVGKQLRNRRENPPPSRFPVPFRP